MNEKRAIPVEDKFMNRKISDILYGYLQSISYLDKSGKTRFVYKDHYSPSIIQEYFGIDENGRYKFQRLAITRAMRVLIEFGYVREITVEGLKGNYVKAYELPFNVDSIFQIIPLETLKYLLDASNSNVIKIYVYLLNKYNCFGDKFEFTNKHLLNKCFGVKSNTNSLTNKSLANRLDFLKKLGLIDWCEYVKVYNGKKIKTKRLKFVNKYISK
ncbi:MAG: hypothetical protein GX190_01045 [Mollicutes bacterium]|nr:hypothetical protein [Mollicutes bacterium]